MKVILQQDVARLGKKHEEVDVADGYALNRLIPSGQAVPADKRYRSKIAQQEQMVAEQERIELQYLQEAVDALTEKPLTIHVQANEAGSLFQAVNIEAVVAAATSRGLNLSASMLVLPEEPVKQVGSYSVTLRVADRSETVPIEVVAQS